MSDEQDRKAPPTGTVADGEPPVTRADLIDLTEWLDARLERIDARFARLDEDTGDVTRQITGDLAGLRADLLYLHERLDAGQSFAMLAKGVRTEIVRAEQARASKGPSVGLITIMAIAVIVLLVPGLTEAVLAVLPGR